MHTSHISQLTFLQLVLISPLHPVRGLIFPIFTMDFAKSLKKVEDRLAYLFTRERVEEEFVST